jgi:hypothetical protein
MRELAQPPRSLQPEAARGPRPHRALGLSSVLARPLSSLPGLTRRGARERAAP